MAIKALFRARVIGFLALLSLLIAGCASGTNSSGGIKTDFGVDTAAKTITLGILTPLSGPAAASIGVPLTRGIQVFFDHVNDNGGIKVNNNGTIESFKVKFIVKDNKYPDTQQQVVDYNAIRNQVLMIAESLGTPTTFAIKDLADKDHMLVAAATLSSALAREKYLILEGTPYRLQVENAFDYVVNTLHDTGAKVGIIYQNDDYGQDGLTGFKEAVAAYHLQDVGEEAFNAGDKDVSAQVLALKSAGAKYVFMTSIPTDTATILVTAATVGFSPQWILQSPAYSTLLLGVPALVPLLTHNLWLIGNGAIWGDTSKPGMVQMLADVQKYAPDQKPDGFFEAGYAYSYAVKAILQKAADSGDLTRDGLYKAFSTIGTVDLGGINNPIHYGTSGNPNDRVPSRDSQIFVIDPTQPTTIKPISDDFTGTAAAASNF